MANGPIDNKSTVQDTIEQELENYKMMRQKMREDFDTLSLGMPSAQDVTEALGTNEQFAEKYVGTRVPGITPLIPKTKEVHDKNVMQLGKYYTQNKDRLNDLDDPTAMTDYSNGLYNKLKKGAKYFYRHQDLLAMVNDHVMVEAENRGTKIDARARSNYINAAINTTIPKLLTEGDREGAIEQIQIVNSMYNWFEQQDRNPNSDTGRFITSVYNDVSGRQDNLNSFLQQSILNPNRNFTLNDYTLAMTSSQKFEELLAQQSQKTLSNELSATSDMGWFGFQLAADALIGQNGLLVRGDQTFRDLNVAKLSWGSAGTQESIAELNVLDTNLDNFFELNKENVKGYLKDIYDYYHSDSVDGLDEMQKMELKHTLNSIETYNNDTVGVSNWISHPEGWNINLEELQEEYISDLHNNADSVEEKVDIDTKNVWFNKYVSGETEKYKSFIDWRETPEGATVYNEAKNIHTEEEVDDPVKVAAYKEFVGSEAWKGLEGDRFDNPPTYEEFLNFIDEEAGDTPIVDKAVDKTFTDFMDGVSFSDSDKSFNKNLVSKEDKTKLLNSHGVNGHNRSKIRSLFRQLQEYKLNQDTYNKFKTEYASATAQKHLIRAEELYNEILEGKKNYENALERGVLAEPKFSLFGTPTPQENLMNE